MPTSTQPLPRGLFLVLVRIATGTKDWAPVPVVQPGLKAETNGTDALFFTSVCLLQKKFVGVQPFIAENKTKEN
jgi:hypothetical protein